MTNKILLTFLLIFFHNIIRAQTNGELVKYYCIADSAKYCENNNQLDEAVYFYKKLLGFTQFEIKNNNYEKLFQIYLKQNKSDSAKYYISQYILNAGPVEHDRFTYLTHDTVSLNLDSLNNLFRFNYAIYNKIYKVFRDDQALRNTIMILSKNQYDSSVRAGIFATCDSLNYVEFRQTIKEIGHLPTAKEIGSRLQGIITMALMVHHLKKDPKFWESMYRTAINNGTIERESFPLVYDYCHYTDLQDSKELNATYLYCEFISYKNPIQIPEPEHPKEVDKLRAEFYLPPLYMKARIERLTLPKNYDGK